MSGKLLVVDGNSIINRAFYALPPMQSSKGVHTNAILGFFNIIFKITDSEKPDMLAIAFDVKHPTFRHEMYPEYKGTRKSMPDELREQVPVLKSLLKDMHIVVLEQPGIEADDILGTLAKKAEAEGYEVSVMSGDRDLLQIVSDKIKIVMPKTVKGVTTIEEYYPKDVMEKYGISPLQIIDLKGLMGDSSDNIPGIPGVGEKTAVKLLQQYETVENTLAHAGEVSGKKLKELLETCSDLALLSKKLATIKTDCDVCLDTDKAAKWDFFSDEAYVTVKNLELNSLIKKFVSAKSGEKVSTESAGSSVIETQSTDSEPITDNNTNTTVTDLDALVGAVRYIDDFSDAEAFFKSVKAKHVGVSFVKQDDEITDMFVCVAGNITCITSNLFINTAYFEDKLKNMCRKSEITVFDLKGKMDHFKSAELENINDITLMAYVLRPEFDKNTAYDPDRIALTYCDEILPSRDELKNDERFELKWAVSEAYVADKAYSVLKKSLSDNKETDLYEKIERPLTGVLYNMEKRGVCVDRQVLKEMSDEMGQKLSEYEKNIYELAGEEFNINSPKQLGVILFEKRGLDGGKKTKTGYSTSAEVLEKLKGEDPIIDQILEYRQISKLKSTYADGLAEYIQPDGRIHTKFNQTITATGRLSSSDPNLQNIPMRTEYGRLMRKVFYAPEGYCFVDGDYSQIELRVLAHLSGDEKLIDAFNSDKDIHRATASQVFNVPFDEVTPLQRRNAKAVNFGIIYGMSAFGLGQDLGISNKEADAYIKQYFKTYPSIRAYLDEIIASAKEKGYAETMFGRKRNIPELKASNFMVRQFGERVAMNSPIQGTAADIMKLAMLRVEERLTKEGLKSKLILQIHDELLIETALDEKEYVIKLLEEEMMNAVKLSVALKVDIESGQNWYETK